MSKLKNILLLTSILITTVAFNFQHNPPSGWYQQFLPNIGGRQIADMTFLDSLTGYIVTTRLASPDTSYILKTTNGGDNWSINYIGTGVIFKQVRFLNQNIGFVTGSTMLKTTNAGLNWFSITIPTPNEDIAILNQDTMWTAYSESLTGGVYRTTNGGLNWDRQLSLGSQNPTRIYFYNARIGFITNDGGFYVRKTTNSGVNWSVVVNNEGFNDIYFIDSLTGWRAYGTSMKKTTDGGLSWTNQTIPQGGYIVTSVISRFSVLNKDTIWGVGGYIQYPNFQKRGMIYTTTNGGTNWLYQVPDTSQVNVFRYEYVQFINKNCGWVYASNRGIHTKVGGDPLTIINLANSQIPSQYILGQNYPNPFNPTTTINYEVKSAGFISIRVFDLQGREAAVLINQKHNIGSYTVSFDAAKYSISSGIYLYSMYADGNIIDTRKMILLK